MTSSPEPESKRPLSPHLQVYRLPYNANMSIAGRGVGVGLAGLVTLLLMWFVAIVWSPELFDLTMSFIDTPYTKYAFLLLAFVVFFYIGNGIRHVMWDFVVGVNVKTGVMTGNVVLLLSALLTLGLWFVTSEHWGGDAAPLKAFSDLAQANQGAE